LVNGRLARNVFERAIGRLANRITGIVPLTRELLTTLEPDDIVMEGVPEGVWTVLENEDLSFRMECPGCHHSCRVPQKLLGHKVHCKRCDQAFEAGWGEVVDDG
jgi:hypothetical protein